MAIERVAVLGGGLMGSGIAEVSAAAGLSVAVREIDERATAAAHARIESSLARAVRRGKLEEDAAADALGRIQFTTHLHDLADADLVVEAVPEDVALKTRVLSEVADAVDTDALIASNTSSIPIAQLAAAVPAPQRVLGLHFVSPVQVLGLVEL